MAEKKLEKEQRAAWMWESVIRWCWVLAYALIGALVVWMGSLALTNPMLKMGRWFGSCEEQLRFMSPLKGFLRDWVAGDLLREFLLLREVSEEIY